MIDTSGPTSGTQFATYDPDTRSWRMWPDTGLWGSIEYSETWPKTGSMSGGRAFELPTSVPPITANASSSWLPTPRAADPKASMGSPGAARHVAAGMGSLAEVIGVHLPTPTVGNATGTNERRGGARSDEKLLPGVVLDFLPTPTASDTKGAAQRDGRIRNGRARPDSDERLAGAVERFLPTITASDASKARDNPAQANRKSPAISAVSQYFPTPRTTDANGPGKHGTGGPDLRTVIAEFSGEPMPPLFDVGND
ncbi:hypothetical protein R4255_17355 [Rhodococcus oxybenzonivorans]|nr:MULTISPECIES: hypothetical protein [Rhodococcus]MDV7244502.1 hypothetical protein [Rhodococcus oxybenzonivorans]MDV7274255.1 hypothetical protein [Rhodococcus oxybenzonivorans]MDV7337859.1 hypothetical protein [Rhodococcus oxybenzonivorans]MDV7345205.1 hypothetical protein [Rhodococcus oxybenzonivorans]MDV8105672.1 hypothetical protein [Rhodococcus sp. IEGM 69]